MDGLYGTILAHLTRSVPICNDKLKAGRSTFRALSADGSQAICSTSRAASALTRRRPDTRVGVFSMVFALAFVRRKTLASSWPRASH